MGYHAAKEMVRRGYQVSILALPPMPADGLFSADIPIHLKDLGTLSDMELLNFLSGMDAVVFAAGVDDRVTPKSPAYPFFKKHNVDPVCRLARLCAGAGVGKLIILGSYFAHFDRIWPELRLREHHPYIRSRVEQAASAITEAGDRLVVVSLELPYIFGTMPGRTPLWKPLIRYVLSRYPLFYPRGGTTCVTVRQVAQAICGAVERIHESGCIPVGGENLAWSALLDKIMKLGGVTKHVITLPDWIVLIGAWLIRTLHKLQGRESGLEPVRFVRLQTSETYLDASISQGLLGYESGGLDEALKDTMSASIQSKSTNRIS